MVFLKKCPKIDWGSEAQNFLLSIVALSPDSQVVVIADGKDLAFFSAENGDKIGAVSGVHAEHVTAVVFDKVCGWESLATYPLI